MGRRKQHCPKKANDNLEPNDDNASKNEHDEESIHAQQELDSASSEKASMALGNVLDPSLQLQADLLKSWLLEQNPSLFPSGLASLSKDEDLARLVQMQAAQKMAMQAQAQEQSFQQQYLRRKALLLGSEATNGPLDLRKPGFDSAASRFLSPLHLSMIAQQQQHPNLFPGALGSVKDPNIAPKFPANAMVPSMHPLMQNNYALSTLHRMSELAQQSLQKTPTTTAPPAALSRSSEPCSWPNSCSTPTTRLKAVDKQLTKEIFSCVWCQEKLTSLAELTQHLREANHGGPRPSAQAAHKQNSGGAQRKSPQQQQHQQHHHPQQQQQQQSQQHHQTGKDDSTSSASPGRPASSSPQSTAASKEAASATPPSRKLVRGQDVWLGKGEEQTKQILKCMWCGESFKSLADMTVHMTETKHYTKVISQEQISSWRNSGSSGIEEAASPTGRGRKEADEHNARDKLFSGKDGSRSPSSNRDEPLGSFQHHSRKRQNGSSCAATASSSASLASKEKRKKSLPVRKLLELERKQQSSNAAADEPELKRSGPGGRAEDDDLVVAGQLNPTSSSSILGSLEKMVESSFAGKVATSASSSTTASPSAPPLHQPRPAGLLQRLGLDPCSSQLEAGPAPHPLHLFLKQQAAGNSRETSRSPKSDDEEDKAQDHQQVSQGPGSSAKPSPAALATSESKFLKYSELAKQLSGR